VSNPFAERMAAIDQVMLEVRAECARAIAKHAPMKSPHEGYAVILEEVDELWQEVKGNRGRDLSALEEAVQIAAMGVRYVADLRG
jgi:NTP pyrophosphatase (non-canonical NTP hydrolase)